MDPFMWLPVGIAMFILPSTIGLWMLSEQMIAKEIQELNELNGWES